ITRVSIAAEEMEYSKLDADNNEGVVNKADEEIAKAWRRRQYHVEPNPDTAADKKGKHRSNGLTYHPDFMESALYGSLSDKDDERLREYTRRINEGLPTTDADRQWYDE